MCYGQQQTFCRGYSDLVLAGDFVLAGDMTGDGAVAVAGNSGDMAADLGRESASESAPESESLAPCRHA